MGIWYDFYLEKRIKNEKWMPLKYNDSECLYSDYSPKIIDEEVYAKFKDNIKENYIYHEWDTYYGEEYYLYELMPIINEILKENDLTINEVRLLCKIG